MSAFFIAQYHGFCADCGEELKGSCAFYDTHGDIVHERCPDTIDDKFNELPLCDRCFCRHVGEC